MVIDADLRKPTLHDLVGLKQGAGLVEVLRREVPLAEALATDPRAAAEAPARQQAAVAADAAAGPGRHRRAADGPAPGASI